MQGELEIRKKLNGLFIIGMVMIVTIFVVDVNKYTGNYDIAFLSFGIGTFLIGFGLGATWMLNKWVKSILTDDDK